MRTTIDLDDDVAALVQKLRHEKAIGLSRAVNDLIRRGADRPQGLKKFVQKSSALGLKVNVDHMGRVLEMLDEEDVR